MFHRPPMNPSSISSSRSGIVLLIVLGILGLLSVLAITFVSISQLERSVSRNYMDRTRSLLAAESGIEVAVNRIMAWRGALTMEELEDLRYDAGAPGVSLIDAVKPSFDSADAAPSGVQGAVSGFIGSGSYVPNGDIFKLKVTDLSTRLHLNGSDDLTDPDDPTSARLFGILTNLVTALFAEPDDILGANIAGAILTARFNAGGTFSDLDEVRQAIVEPGWLTAEDYDLLAENFTLHSWVDPNTIKPSPAYTSIHPFRHDPKEFNYPEGGTLQPVPSLVDVQEAYADDIHFWRSVQHRGMRMEPRAPVNVNATSRSMIHALLQGIQGIYVYEYGREDLWANTNGFSMGRGYSLNAMMGWPLTYGEPVQDEYLNFSFNWHWDIYLHNDNFFGDGALMDYSPDASRFTETWGSAVGNGFGSVRRTEAVDFDLAFDLSQAMYDRIHIDGRPFRTWQEFRGFLYEYFEVNGFWFDAEYIPGVTSFEQPDLYKRYQADAILAALCPNSQLNDFNPDAVIWKTTDKADLLRYTTEFCFEPTGTFEIHSAGAVVGPDQTIVSSQEIQTVIEVFRTARITTQSQFFGADTVDPIEAQAELFGVNTTPITTAGADSNIGSVKAPDGTLTQSYPEPVVLGQEHWVLENTFDGYVCLATIQNNHTDFSPPQFRASFNGTLDADEADYLTSLYDDPEEKPFAGRLLFTAEELENDPLLTCGNLFVDGGYSEAYRTLIYHSGDPTWRAATGNLGGARGGVGTMSFWIKPNFLPEQSPRVRKFFSASNVNKSPYMAAVDLMGPAGVASAVKYPGVPVFEGDIDAFFSSMAMYNYHQYQTEFCLYYIPNGEQHDPYVDPYVQNGYWFTQRGSILDPSSFPTVPIPNRSLVLWTHHGTGRSGGPDGSNIRNNLFSGYISDAVNNEGYPSRDTDGDGLDDGRGNALPRFQGHRWNFMLIGWDPSISSDETALLQVNQHRHQISNEFLIGWNGFGSATGKPIWRNAWPPDDGIVYSFDPAETFNFRTVEIAPIGAENPMRFGEWARSTPNYSADSTYDEIVIIPSRISEAQAYDVSRDGRYYNNPDEDAPGSYTTPMLDSRRLVALSGAADVFGNVGIQLRSVSWTLWWPDDIMKHDKGPGGPLSGPSYNRNPDCIPSDDLCPLDANDSSLPDLPDPYWETDPVKFDWDPMTVDIETGPVTGAGTWLFGDSTDILFAKAKQGETGYSNAQGTALIGPDKRRMHLRAGEGMRLRFFFNEIQDSADPLQASPVLDDITITFAFDRPEIIRWQFVK